MDLDELNQRRQLDKIKKEKIARGEVSGSESSDDDDEEDGDGASNGDKIEKKAEDKVKGKGKEKTRSKGVGKEKKSEVVVKKGRRRSDVDRTDEDDFAASFIDADDDDEVVVDAGGVGDMGGRGSRRASSRRTHVTSLLTVSPSAVSVSNGCDEKNSSIRGRGRDEVDRRRSNESKNDTEKGKKGISMGYNESNKNGVAVPKVRGGEVIELLGSEGEEEGSASDGSDEDSEGESGSDSDDDDGKLRRNKNKQNQKKEKLPDKKDGSKKGKKESQNANITGKNNTNKVEDSRKELGTRLKLKRIIDSDSDDENDFMDVTISKSSSVVVVNDLVREKNKEKEKENENALNDMVNVTRSKEKNKDGGVEKDREEKKKEKLMNVSDMNKENRMEERKKKRVIDDGDSDDEILLTLEKSVLDASNDNSENCESVLLNSTHNGEKHIGVLEERKGLIFTESNNGERSERADKETGEGEGEGEGKKEGEGGEKGAIETRTLNNNATLSTTNRSTVASSSTMTSSMSVPVPVLVRVPVGTSHPSAVVSAVFKDAVIKKRRIVESDDEGEVDRGSERSRESVGLTRGTDGNSQRVRGSDEDRGRDKEKERDREKGREGGKRMEGEKGREGGRGREGERHDSLDLKSKNPLMNRERNVDERNKENSGRSHNRILMVSRRNTDSHNGSRRDNESDGGNKSHSRNSGENGSSRKTPIGPPPHNTFRTTQTHQHPQSVTSASTLLPGGSVTSTSSAALSTSSVTKGAHRAERGSSSGTEVPAIGHALGNGGKSRSTEGGLAHAGREGARGGEREGERAGGSSFDMEMNKSMVDSGDGVFSPIVIARQSEEERRERRVGTAATAAHTDEIGSGLGVGVGAGREKGGEESAYWTCSSCTFSNSCQSDPRKCCMCDTRRQAQHKRSGGGNTAGNTGNTAENTGIAVGDIPGAVVTGADKSEKRDKNVNSNSSSSKRKYGDSLLTISASLNDVSGKTSDSLSVDARVDGQSSTASNGGASSSVEVEVELQGYSRLVGDEVVVQVENVTVGDRREGREGEKDMERERERERERGRDREREREREMHAKRRSLAIPR